MTAYKDRAALSLGLSGSYSFSASQWTSPAAIDARSSRCALVTISYIAGLRSGSQSSQLSGPQFARAAIWSPSRTLFTMGSLLGLGSLLMPYLAIRILVRSGSILD